jgi:hypothetical protein
MQNFLKYLFIGLLIVSCKTKKVMVAEQVATAEKNKAEEVIANHYKNKIDFQTASIKASVSFENSKQSLDATADVRIKKDEIIWINLKVFGLPMAKAIITPNRVSFYEKLNSVYLDGDFKYLSELLGTDLDFNKVQNLLLGQPMDDLRKEEFVMEIAENYFKIKNKNQTETQKYFSFESANYLLKIQDLNQPAKNRGITIVYPAFQTIDNMFLPTGISILAKQKDQVKIEVGYKKINFNENLTYPYDIPKGYTPINID